MARPTTRAARLGALTLTIALFAGLPVTSAAADEEPGTPTSTAEPAPTSAPQPDPTGTEPPPSSDVPVPPPSSDIPVPPSSDVPPPMDNPPAEAPADTAQPVPPAPRSVAADEAPDLRVTASFDKGDYIGSDHVTVTLTITNAGRVDALDVSGSTYTNLSLDDYTESIDFGGDTTIRAGATRVIQRSGYLYNPTAASVDVYAAVSSGAVDAQPDDNQSRISAPVRAATGTFAGLVFGDRDTDGVQDPGEPGLANVSVTLNAGGVGSKTGNTDAAGRFSIPDLPAGRYTVGYWAPGWTFPSGGPGTPSSYVLVTPQSPEVRVAALPGLDNLRPTVVFDRDTYRPGETAELTIVLSNNSMADFTGVKATCFDYDSIAGVAVGPGWGVLAGDGITVPAQQSVAVKVHTPVPAEAARFGFVTVNCGFQPDRYPPAGAMFLPVTARVPGDLGTGQARLEREDFSPVAGVPVVITDPRTGADVARATTDADGFFTVTGLPATKYDVRIDGPWVPSYAAMITLPVEAGDRYTGLQSWRIKPGPAEANLRPNLLVSASFEKPSYRTDETTVRIRLTVTNIGPAAADGVVTDVGWYLGSNGMGELDPLGPGARIEAGATRVFDIQGDIFTLPGVLLFTGNLVPKARDIYWPHSGFAAVAAVERGLGSYTGVLYGDENGNGVMDPGEGLPFVPIGLSGGSPYGSYHQVTDAEGRFAFTGIPSGRYYPIYSVPDGWFTTYGDVVVPNGGNTPVEVRAFRANDDLLAAVAFDRDSYAVGDTAHIAFTLTNRSATDLTGVTAFCSGPGNSNQIDSYGPGWGDIADGAPGVTVPANSTVTFDVWTIIPEGGLDWGYVSVECEIGPPPHLGGATAYARARVPGGVGGASGVLLDDRSVEPLGIADTKIVFTDDISGAVAGRAVTDATGHFAVQDLPAGRYNVVVVGPWKITNCWCQGVFAGRVTDNYEVRVVPGAVQPDPDAVPADPPAAEPEPTTQDEIMASTVRLASTGAAVTGLLAGGILLLLAGLGLVLLRRRPRRTD